MATRPPRRTASGAATDKTRRNPRSRSRGPQATAPGELEDVADRAARLGITVERVLLEYARIAFADLRHIVEWGPDGLAVKPPEEISDADAAAISEIAPGTAGTYRVKFYDKKAALDAIARHLGMFPAAPRRREEKSAPDPAEDPREVLARRLARLAAGEAAE